MSKFTFDTQPKIRYLSNEEIEKIHEGTLKVLEETGVLVECERAIDIYEKGGCTVDRGARNVKIPRALVGKSIESTPESFEVWDRSGEKSYTVGGENYYFDPGSSGLNFLESDNKTARPADTKDMVEIYRLTDALPHIKFAATAVSPDDVPEENKDAYRVYHLLKNTDKPFISGAFDEGGAHRIQKLLAAARGGAQELKEKPLAILDVCSQPPLKWGDTSCNNIIDHATYGIPIETISVPMPGAATPATMAGSVIVHLAESLSGMVLAQLVSPGCRMVLGGAPMTFDMRYSTTSLNAVESSLISCAYAQMARYYGVPSHCYAGLADPKVVDFQAGMESALSALMAVMGGVNIISGPGMIDFVNTFSLEKLAMDNEIIAMADRLFRGIEVNEDTMAVGLIGEMGSEGDYLTTSHTRKYFRKETYIPPEIIDKKNRPAWQAEGQKTIFDRAKEQVEKTLASHTPKPLTEEQEKAIEKVAKEIGI
jgi:trimethylamine--corrinoid protein Co-methyltransferase